MNGGCFGMTYNKGKMKDLAKRDGFIGMMLKDMVKRGNSEDKALKVLYNSEVLDGGSAMQNSYDLVGEEE